MKISEILEKKGREIFSINENSLILNVIEELSKRKVGCLLVKDDSSCISGIISERDIIYIYNKYKKDIGNIKISEVMTPISKIFTINENEDIQNAMLIMTTKKIRHLPIVNDKKEVCGILSIGDVVNSLLSIKETQIMILQDYINGKYPK